MLVAALALLAVPAAVHAQEAAPGAIPSPEEFFGHEMGADRQLARWDRLVEYYQLLGNQSDRIIVEGNERLMPGQPLMVQQRNEDPAPPAP